jgi:hypothetical protein
MAAFPSLEVDELAVVVSDLDDGDGVVLGCAEVVHLGQDRHQAEGSTSSVDVASLPDQQYPIISAKATKYGK